MRRKVLPCAGKCFHVQDLTSLKDSLEDELTIQMVDKLCTKSCWKFGKFLNTMNLVKQLNKAQMYAKTKTNFQCNGGKRYQEPPHDKTNVTLTN